MAKKEKKETPNEKVSIIPLKDHKLLQNEVFYDLKKDKEIEIDSRYLETLKKEKVIS